MSSSVVTEKKNVMITVSIMGQFPEMYRVAELLKKSENFNPIIYFNLGVYPQHANIELCLKNGIDVLNYSLGFLQKPLPPEKNIKSDSSSVNTIKRESSNLYYEFKQYIKSKPLLFSLVKEVYLFFLRCFHLIYFSNLLTLQIKRNRKEARFLDVYNIKLLIFADDNVGYNTPYLIKAAHKKNIKSVVFPYTFANQFEYLESAYFHNRLVKNNYISLITAWLYPKWTYQYKNKKLLNTDYARILMSEIYGVSPPNPWVMNSGFADVIAVESQFMKEYYAQAGIPQGKMLETGFPSLDSLYDIVSKRTENRKKIALKYNLDNAKSWVLCAIPPPQWPRLGVGFKSYDHFLNDFFAFFNSVNDIELIFKFHPRESASDIVKMCDKYKIKYISEDTVELIGLCDMFIASVSSTIRWALALGLPVINYDIYNYNYGDFDSAKNYYTVVKFDEFKNLFKGLHDKLTYSASLNIDNFQQKFALLDGRAGLRILNLFTELTND